MSYSDCYSSVKTWLRNVEYLIRKHIGFPCKLPLLPTTANASSSSSSAAASMLSLSIRQNLMLKPKEVLSQFLCPLTLFISLSVSQVLLKPTFSLSHTTDTEREYNLMLKPNEVLSQFLRLLSIFISFSLSQVLLKPTRVLSTLFFSLSFS